MTRVVKVMVAGQSCFAMEVQGSERHLLGKGNYPGRREEKGVRANRPPRQFTGSGQVVR